MCFEDFTNTIEYVMHLQNYQPTIKAGISFKKCDSQDFYISNHMQNKLVYVVSLAYGMEIL